MDKALRPGAVGKISGTGREHKRWFGSGSWAWGGCVELGCEEKKSINHPLREAGSLPEEHLFPRLKVTDKGSPPQHSEPQPHCPDLDLDCGRKENTEYFSQEPKPPILKFLAEEPGQVEWPQGLLSWNPTVLSPGSWRGQRVMAAPGKLCHLILQSRDIWLPCSLGRLVRGTEVGETQPQT